MKKTLQVSRLSPKHGPNGGVKRAKVIGKLALGLPASGIAHLPTGEVLFVHDKKGVYLARADKKPKRLLKRKGLEGIAADGGGRRVFVLCEDEGTIQQYDVERAHGEIQLRSAGAVKQVSDTKGRKNHGWEGLAYRSTGDDGAAELVCTHEARPRRVGVYALPDLANGWTASLPRKVKKLLPDIADVAVDGRTGHLFLVSDRARTVVELAVAPQDGRTELIPLSSFRLGLKKSRKPEGLSFDAKGRLWVSLDYEKNDNARRGIALGIELAREDAAKPEA
jgi:hypothetical protein